MSEYHRFLSRSLPDPEELFRRKKYLEKVRSDLEKRIAQAPEGSLIITRKAGSSSAGFYHALAGSGRTYLNRTKRAFIRDLAQKEYDQKALRLINKELVELRALLDYCKSPKLEDALELCLPEKREYIAPAVPSDEEFRDAWLAQKYDKKDPADGMHVYPTEKGDKVCSKSEAMEADYMFHHAIYYLYEKRLNLIDRGRPVWRYPDFTILDPVTREEVIFEHFGMVDDEGSASNMFDKIRLYEENGFVIGENFLFVFETREHPFTMDQFIAILNARFRR